MKKMNLLAMSLVSAAALSFSSCSSNDDLTGGGAGTQSQVKGFYMTLAVQTPTSNGTRTSIGEKTPTEDATAVEAAVKNGTFYLVDANGSVVFSKTLTATDWAGASGAIKDPAAVAKDGRTTLKIEVENVAAGATYKVYFKAGSTKMTDVEPFTIPTGTSKSGIFTTDGIKQIFTAQNPFDKTCAVDNDFSMFNQNDATTNGNGYTVTFTNQNKEGADNFTPAVVKYGDNVAPIKIERVTARVDVPTSESTLTTEALPADASAALKKAVEDAKNKVTKIELVQYALSNVTNKTYVMQNWDVVDNVWNLAIPAGATLSRTKDDFGSKYLFNNGGFKALTGATNDYIFENNKDEATTMYFEYKVTLDGTKFEGTADFEDGTFYRYNNVIYTSFAQILKAYGDVTGLFDKKTATQLRTELAEAKKEPTAETEESVETKLSKFREKYGIEVFNEGKTYYKQVITDNQLGKNVIQRNTIYRLDVNKIFNVGAQVPNGEIDKNGLFYLDVTVTVNPWVLNVQGVELGD